MSQTISEFMTTKSLGNVITCCYGHNFLKSAGVLGTLSVNLSYSLDYIISHSQDFLI